MKIAIAGLGLIGGSLALRLVSSGHSVIAWNHRSAPYENACKNGIECVKTLEELVTSSADILVLCTPLKAMDNVLEKISSSHALSPEMTITDVGSVKREVLQTIEKYGLRDQFVGAHPMAGNELAGFDAANASLYDGATWAVTVEKDTSFNHFLTVARMICQGARNRFIVTTAREHDAATAQISHMPHVVSTALASQLAHNPQSNIALALSAGSWRDMTRIALTTPDRTQAMVEENPDNVAYFLHDMAHRLEEVAQILENPDSDVRAHDLEEFFLGADSYRSVREKSAHKIPEGIYTVDFRSSENWKAELISASAKGGRVEDIDSCQAILRDFPHMRDMQ